MTLFETANQPMIFFCCVLYGFLSGIIFDVSNLFCFLCKKNVIVQIFCDIISTLLCFAVVFFICYNQNFGQFRLYIPLVFFTFVYFERMSLGKLVAKGYARCYNIFEKLTKKVSKVLNKNKQNGTTKEK